MRRNELPVPDDLHAALAALERADCAFVLGWLANAHPDDVRLALANLPTRDRPDPVTATHTEPGLF